VRLWNVLRGLTPLAAIAHVAFDLDGTLVDSRADLAAAVNHVRIHRGLAPLDVATVTGFVGDGAAKLVGRALGPAATDEAAVAHFLGYYHEHCLDETRLYPGMHAALGLLRSNGRSLSVLTNKPRALAERVLAGLGIDDAFIDVVGGDSLPTRKPNPRGLWRVAARAAVPIERTLLVGDSPVDLDTATAAGSAFCGVAWGFASDRLQDRTPTYLARDARHLLALLDLSRA